MKLLGISTDDLQNPAMARAFVMRLNTLSVGFALAVMAGYWLGNGQYLYLAAFPMGMLVVVLVVFGLQRKAWILIPLTWIMTGSLGKLPVPLAVRDLGVLLATASYVAYRVLSQENLRPKLHLLDLLVGLNFIYLAFTLVIHPVGFLVFGSESIGGRPVLNICIALMAYWVIIRLPNSVTQVSHIPYYVLASAMLVGGLALILFVVPSLTPVVSSWYSGVDMSSYATMLRGEHGFQRLRGMEILGLQLFLVLCAYYSPGSLFDPRRGRFYVMLLATVCILAGGYRSMLVWSMAALAIAGCLHRRWRQTAVAGSVGALLLLLLAFGQGRFYQLPEAVQRSLTFLPGQWSEVVAKDAEGSSTARFKLWHDVIEWGTIKNWWIGDGFGANLEDAIAIASSKNYTEFITLTGAYHSGPLSAIRYVGTCGLALMYLLSISAAFYAYRCVNECRGTLLLPVAIYFAIQLIWGPIHYTFVFGGYDASFPDLLFQVACLRLLIRMADELKRNSAAKTKLAPVQVQPTAAAIA